MELDTDRVRGIVEADHSFYGSAPAQHRTDERLNPQAAEFIGQFLTPEMHVLDIGCGSGETLIGHSQEFATGVGVDNDEAHVKLAEEAKSASSVANVEIGRAHI